jgi:hypothetical protein
MMNEFLQSVYYNSFIQLTSVTSQNNMLELGATIPGKSNWNNFTSEFYKSNQLAFTEYLFRKIAFNFSIPSEKLNLKLSGPDQIIFVTGNDSLVETEVQSRMGSGRDTVKISIENIKSVSKLQHSTMLQQMQIIQDRIISSLHGFFIQYQLKGSSMNFIAIAQPLKNQLRVDVNRIKKAAMERPESWEKYALILNFRQEGNNLFVYTIVNGQFGPGIGSTEALTYYDLQEKKPEVFDLFCARLSGLIQNDLLTP